MISFAPFPRQRKWHISYTQLTEVERYPIQAFLKSGYSQKAIADELNRHPSTIGRKLSRNTGLRSYRLQQAQHLAEKRKALHCHTQMSASCWEQIEGLLRENWSPEQIHGWQDTQELPAVSPEWIYQYILNDEEQRGHLHIHLRCQKQRKKRYGSTDKRGQLIPRIQNKNTNKHVRRDRQFPLVITALHIKKIQIVPFKAPKLLP